MAGGSDRGGALRGWLPIALARWLERMAYAHSARIVALSPGIREGIARTGYPLDHIALIPNGCDLDLFQVPEESGKAFRRQLDWLQDRPLVVYTGTLGLVNQVEYLAHLAAEMRTLDPDVRFLVIGDGKQEPVVRAQARELNVLDENLLHAAPCPQTGDCQCAIGGDGSHLDLCAFPFHVV